MCVCERMLITATHARACLPGPNEIRAVCCVGLWRWKVKALIRRVPLRGRGGWLHQNPARTSHWIRLIRREQWGCIDHLSGQKTLGSLSLWTNPTEMFVNFIYYRMLVDVAIFHRIIEKSSSTHGRHSVFTCRRDSNAFDVLKTPPPAHLLSLLFIYFHLSVRVCGATTDRIDLKSSEQQKPRKITNICTEATFGAKWGPQHRNTDAIRLISTPTITFKTNLHFCEGFLIVYK